MLFEILIAVCASEVVLRQVIDIPPVEFWIDAASPLIRIRDQASALPDPTLITKRTRAEA